MISQKFFIKTCSNCGKNIQAHDLKEILDCLFYHNKKEGLHYDNKKIDENTSGWNNVSLDEVRSNFYNNTILFFILNI